MSQCIRLRPLLYLCLSVLLLGNAWALTPDKPISQYVFDRWDTENGMPQVTTLASLQDTQGFLWFATQNGLTRFDGQRFKTFRRRHYPGLANDFIHSLAEGERGRLWIGTAVGVSSFLDGQFQRHGGDVTGAVHAIDARGNDGPVIAAESGLYTIADGGLSLLFEGPAYALHRDADGRLWSGHAGYLRSAGKRFDIPADGPAELRVLAIAHYHDELWLGTPDGLRVFDPVSAQVRRPQGQPPALTDLRIETMHVDSDGVLWIGSEVGLYRLGPNGYELDTTHLPNAQVRSFAEDHEGSLWVGTTSMGVARLWNGKLTQFGRSAGLADPMVWGVAQAPDDTIWAFTRVGTYTLENGQFTRRYASQTGHPTSLNGYWDSLGRQWIATAGGLEVYRDGQRIDLPQLARFPKERVYAIREFSPGEIWLATSAYLYRVHPAGLERIDSDNGLEERFVRDVHVEDSGRLWVATDNGLYRGSKDQLERVRDPALGSGMIATMIVFNDEIWFGLQGYGAARFKDGAFRNFSSSDGLHSDVVFYILRDDQRRLWFSGPEGLTITPIEQFDAYARGDIDALTPRVLGADWDQQRAQVNGGHAAAGLAASDGLFYFPTLNGLLQVDPQNEQINRAPPPVEIVAVDSRDQVWQWFSNQHSELTLPPGSRNLEIRYAGLSFQNSERVRYRYRMLGVDDDWVDVGSRALAIYTNLAPGDYTFEVMAANNDGIWSTEPASLGLSIQPFFYQTTWFYALCVLAFLLLVYLVFRWRVRQIEQQRRLLRERVEQRTRELAEANRQLEQASLTDALTDLRNRRFLTSHIEQDVAVVRRAYTAPAVHPNRDLLFLMLDLDHFKQINDQHGHAVGDQVLKELAERLIQVMRESDYAIRWGGEEFLLVARNTERSQAGVVASRLCEAINREPFHTDDGPLPCSASVGFATYPFDATEPGRLGWEAVIDLADIALYEAKRRGRNQWVGVEHVTGTSAEAAFEAARNDLPAALASGQVTLKTSGEQPSGSAD